MTLNLATDQHSRDPQPEPTVKHAQQDLIRRGYNVGQFGADGQFGQATQQAVIRFQAHNGLDPDGVIGPHTWSKLNARFPAPKPTPGRKVTQAAHASYLIASRATGSDHHPALRYQYGFEITDLSQKYPARADCSEIVQWAVYQCVHDSWVDGSANQYAACRHISVHDARNTPGALVFLSSDGPSSIHHVGMVYHSEGKVWVAQARSAHMEPECGRWPFDDQSWKYAGLVPVLHYS